jgi:lipoprotein-anchoring transpeptidase ErfK/SrfK
MAYEDTSPVFVTLISPGRGGDAQKGRDPLETSATPLGRFSITGKFVTSTMIAPNDYLHSDVPFAQNFTGPYALHSAYWHDNWGNLMSGGCINLSPIDARFMFDWTEPPAPAGWHGTRWLPYLEPSTTLLIHR